jgi:hypothetical protein
MFLVISTGQPLGTFLAAAPINTTGVSSATNLIIRVITTLPRVLLAALALRGVRKGGTILPAVLITLAISIPSTLPRSLDAFGVLVETLLGSGFGVFLFFWGLMWIEDPQHHMYVLGVLLLIVGILIVLVTDGIITFQGA